MNVEIFDCDQGSADWFAARLGIVTASEFDSVMSAGKGNAPSKTRRTYMLKLIGERLTGEPSTMFSNVHTERGHQLEPEARSFYAMLKDVEPQQVGFIRRGQVGASPDSLVGSDGLLEIKTKLPHLHLDLLLGNELPNEHRAQCQGQMWVAERQWLDFMSYWPGLPPVLIRVPRDDEYIEKLSGAVDLFLREMAQLQQQIADYRVAA